ncbi:MAG: hypothetical protein ACRENT_03200 [Thermodesulfobacteriota bacterium]
MSPILPAIRNVFAHISKAGIKRPTEAVKPLFLDGPGGKLNTEETWGRG